MASRGVIEYSRIVLNGAVYDAAYLSFPLMGVKILYKMEPAQ